MTKNRMKLLLCLAPLLLACGQQAPTSSSVPASATELTSEAKQSSQTASSDSIQPSSKDASATPSGDYLFYKLKEGETKDGLEGESLGSTPRKKGSQRNS